MEGEEQHFFMYYLHINVCMYVKKVNEGICIAKIWKFNKKSLSSS